MAKQVVVKLTANGAERVFSYEHALRILQYQQRKNFNEWQLSDSSGWEYTVHGELIKREDTGAAKRRSKKQA